MKKNLVVGLLIGTTLVQSNVAFAGNKTIFGGVIGAVVGGVVGSQFGSGGGKTAATIVGAVAGSLIGGVIGNEMEEADRRACIDAQRRALQGGMGSRTDWDGGRYGSRSGVRGYITTTREGYNNRTGEYCREYSSVIYGRNRTEETREIACTRRDGSWYQVREREVRFGGGVGYGRVEPVRPP